MDIEVHLGSYDEARGAPDKETDSVLKSESEWVVNIDDTHAIKNFLLHNNLYSLYTWDSRVPTVLILHTPSLVNSVVSPFLKDKRNLKLSSLNEI